MSIDPTFPRSSLSIRPPQQRRSRETWARILDAGVEMLEAGGYETFTISAICERAAVAPSAVYDRADTKDALFLAVFEHALSRLRVDYDAFNDSPRWRKLSLTQTISGAVSELGDHFSRHVALLRSIILISGAHPEVLRRGAEARRDLSDRFTSLLVESAVRAGQPIDPDAVRAAFAVAFSTLSMRIAYGPDFTHLPDDDRRFVDQLASMVSSYLLGQSPTV